MNRGIGKEFFSGLFVIMIILLMSFLVDEDAFGEMLCYGGVGNGLYTGDRVFMKNELNLSEKQITEVSNVNTDYHYLYNQNRGNEYRIQTLRIQHRRAIESILTEAQRKKLKDNSYYCDLNSRDKGT